MALGTVTKIDTSYISDGELSVRDVVGPNPYTVGGEVVTGLDLGLTVGSRIDAAEGKAVDPANGYAKWDPVTGTLKFFTAAGVEQGAIDLSGDTYRLQVQGR